MPTWFMGRAEAEAKDFGHTIVWGSIGDRMANGRCSRCGGDLSVAVSREGLCEVTGVVLEGYCQPKPAAASV